MEQQGRVVQTVVTTETTTDYDYEEEEQEDDPELACEIFGLIKGIITLSTLVMMTYILVRGVPERKKKKDISIAQKPNENV